VDVDEVAVSSGSVRHRAQVDPGTPIRLRIHVAGKVRSGSLTVRAPRPPRRGFLGWLLRRPAPRKALPR
jgi:hypothetical protein